LGWRLSPWEHALELAFLLKPTSWFGLGPPKLSYFKVRGLVPPGSYSHDDNQKPATIAVNKSGKGVLGTETDYVQAWKKEHALANG